MGIEKSKLSDQCINTEKIYSLMRYIKESSPGINSMMILRNGYAVMEANFYPYHRDVLFGASICTSAVISLMIGIAIKEGFIRNIGERVVDFFPEVAQNTSDSRKCRITIENLLTMTSGLEWNDVIFDERSSENRMWQSDSQVAYILERPMADEPGSRYNHCFGAPHLLSAILQRVTGKKTSAYAEEKLFKPLGIENIRWHDDCQGITLGCYGLFLKLEDLAKIGQLYLQKGKWDGLQVVPEEWVNASVSKRIDTPDGPWSYYGGGYLLNINRFGGYCVKSLSGCFMYVIPKFQLVIAIAGDIIPQKIHLPEMLIETYILPAAIFKDGKADITKGQAPLDELIEEIGRAPEPEIVKKLPKTARLVSYKTYIMEPASHEEKYTFVFDKKDECLMKVQTNNNICEIPVGLDNVYRVSSSDAHKGYWGDENTFIVHKKMLECRAEYKYSFTFEKNNLVLEMRADYRGDVCTYHGKAENFS